MKYSLSAARGAHDARGFLVEQAGLAVIERTHAYRPALHDDALVKFFLVLQLQFAVVAGTTRNDTERRGLVAAITDVAREKACSRFMVEPETLADGIVLSHCFLLSEGLPKAAC